MKLSGKVINGYRAVRSLDIDQTSRNIFFGCPKKSKIWIDLALIKNISPILLKIGLKNIDETFIELVFIFGLERCLATGDIIAINLETTVKGAHCVTNFFESDGSNHRLLCWIQNEVSGSVCIDCLPFFGLRITHGV